MNRVHLISTVHAESGAATVSELRRLLEGLRPNVIFAEIPVSHVERYRDGSHGTLESRAVAGLTSRHSTVIPVDLPAPPDSFFQESRDLYNALERTSPRYRRLMDEHAESTSVYGFKYLNSARSVECLAKVESEAAETVAWIGQDRLIRHHQFWCDVQVRRERAMMNSIINHCASHRFGVGAFVVGVAHRGPIIEAITSADALRAGVLDWEVVDLWT